MQHYFLLKLLYIATNMQTWYGKSLPTLHLTVIKVKI